MVFNVMRYLFDQANEGRGEERRSGLALRSRLDGNKKAKATTEHTSGNSAAPSSASFQLRKRQPVLRFQTATTSRFRRRHWRSN
ncbi:hypothetical protein DM860_007935 [Cuscuta australis]|uniref:Uncharacterized protein n=1 Tax=Cuscuta australis TaxID=267555 RepID=A0A328E1D5_9ASTE|nr:hypothetical protein DM860_007935 [Cuscuta australis]